MGKAARGRGAERGRDCGVTVPKGACACACAFACALPFAVRRREIGPALRGPSLQAGGGCAVGCKPLFPPSAGCVSLPGRFTDPFAGLA